MAAPFAPALTTAIFGPVIPTPSRGRAAKRSRVRAGLSKGLHVSMRSVSFLLKPGNPCRLAGEHEEVEIAATVGERRLALLRIWATTGKGQWSCRDTSAINVETLHDLLDRECQRVGFIQDGVALVLEQRRSGGALADVRPSSSRRAHVELDDIDPGLLTALQQLRSSVLLKAVWSFRSLRRNLVLCSHLHVFKDSGGVIVPLAASPAHPAPGSTATPARRWRWVRGLLGWRRRTRGPAIRCRSC